MTAQGSVIPKFQSVMSCLYDFCHICVHKQYYLMFSILAWFLKILKISVLDSALSNNIHELTDLMCYVYLFLISFHL